jgi:hypothetical protein
LREVEERIEGVEARLRALEGGVSEIFQILGRREKRREEEGIEE